MVILGVRLDEKKPIRLALTKLFGIGNKTSISICNLFGFTKKLQIRDLSEIQYDQLIKYIKDNFVIEDNLRKLLRDDLYKYIINSSLRGTRHKLGLPVRGQRTCTNGRTKKKFKFSINEAYNN